MAVRVAAIGLAVIRCSVVRFAVVRVAAIGLAAFRFAFPAALPAVDFTLNFNADFICLM